MLLSQTEEFPESVCPSTISVLESDSDSNLKGREHDDIIFEPFTVVSITDQENGIFRIRSAVPMTLAVGPLASEMTCESSTTQSLLVPGLNKT